MPELLLEPGSAGRRYWRDFWHYRELFLFLVWRDILVRYKQTVIGIAWAVARPLLTMVVFTVVFSRIASLRAPGTLPYGLMVMAGVLPWQFFATSLSECGQSVVGNAGLITKVYFPRLIIPAGAVMTSLVDFLLTLAMLGLLMFGWGFCPDWRVLALPCFGVLALGSAFGAGLWLCALNVEYRDFRHVVPFLVQFGLYVSPVGFCTTVVPEKWRLLYALNPMVGVIDGFRWCLLRGQTELWWGSVLASAGLSCALCVSGIWYFRRVERRFADVI